MATQVSVTETENGLETQSPATEPIVTATITQAENYGQMTEAFRQTQNEVASIRLETQTLLQNQQSLQNQTQAELAEIRQQNQRLLAALEEEEEQETLSPDSLNGVTVITPIAETPQTPAQTPKKKQHPMSRFLFGKEEEEAE